MFKRIKKLFVKQKEYKELVFTTKDGIDVFIIKPNYLAIANSQRVRDIEYHLNYIAKLGVDRKTFTVAMDEIVTRCNSFVFEDKASALKARDEIKALALSMKECAETDYKESKNMFDALFCAFFVLAEEDISVVDDELDAKKLKILRENKEQEAFFLESLNVLMKHYGLSCKIASQIAAIHIQNKEQLKRLLSNQSNTSKT